MGKRRWPCVTSGPPTDIVHHAESLQEEFEAVANFARSAPEDSLPKSLRKKISAGVESGVREAKTNGWVRKFVSDKDETSLRQTIIQHIERSAASKARDTVPLQQFTELLDSFDELVVKLCSHRAFLNARREPSPISATDAELGIEPASGHNGLVDEDNDYDNEATSDVTTNPDLLQQIRSMQNDIDVLTTHGPNIGGLVEEDPDDEHDKDNEVLESEGSTGHEEESQNSGGWEEEGFEERLEGGTEDNEGRAQGQSAEDSAGGSVVSELFIPTDGDQNHQQDDRKVITATSPRLNGVSNYANPFGGTAVTRNVLQKHDRDYWDIHQDPKNAEDSDRKHGLLHSGDRDQVLKPKSNRHVARAEKQMLEQNMDLNHVPGLNCAARSAVVLPINNQSTVNRLACMPVRRILNFALDSLAHVHLDSEFQLTEVVLLLTGDVEVFYEPRTQGQVISPDQGMRWGQEIERLIAAPLGLFAVEISSMRKVAVSIETRRRKARTIRKLIKVNVPFIKSLHGNHSITDIYWSNETKGKARTTLVIIFSTAQQGNDALEHGIVWQRQRYVCATLATDMKMERCGNCQRYGHLKRNCQAQSRCNFCAGQHATRDCTTMTPKCLNCDGGHRASDLGCPAREEQRTKLRFPEHSIETKRGKKTVKPATASYGQVAMTSTSFSTATSSAREGKPEVAEEEDPTNIQTINRSKQVFDPLAMTAVVKNLQAEVRELQASISQQSRRKRRRSDSESTLNEPLSQRDQQYKRIKEEP